ncbi:phosphatidylglycerophosphate synthase [Rhizobium sp. BK529]|uniref:CDP-alcohol phosphatidyltransferase family protein n=1 Tax=unclassified Rhizobium TaxID=2613769 RepID=UPI0010467A51|nr:MULTISPECIES: CDP-alcohol phosphatidyltransferase family protein [unclassified Rhizobium]MBB3594006.1 phosphatidylglycerophosphate synthase [Rhizobium sp. BK529]TCS01462.1 phosphatidylglycerophosphate synthase [Rhizobium sp. BK418]
MMESGDRRPLASRNTRWAGAIARWLAARAITPNQISQASMLVAAIAGGAFYVAGQTTGTLRIGSLLLAVLFCQARLLCNLFDGMVAVEGKKAEADGPFWNEFPDRIADLMIFSGVGYGIDMPGLGWAAGAFAVLTAYVRELGRATGSPGDFSGPMAKQHRMAVITVAGLASLLEPLWGGENEILTVGLSIITLGAALTTIRRSKTLVTNLKAR